MIHRFFVWAIRAGEGAPLDRVQMVKGWIEGTSSREQVFDIACSIGEPDPITHRCANNGAKVNMADCSVSQDIGATELKTIWKDPAFKTDQASFYYVRVLENPTCRWSSFDALEAGIAPNPNVPSVIQERAWSSPIWFTPGRVKKNKR